MSLETLKFEFEEYCLEVKEKVLLRAGKPVPLTPKAFDLLLALVENHGRIIEKSELMNRVWTERFVEENNLTFTVSLIRKVLGDDKQNPLYIETVSRRGYRFIAPVREINATNGVTNAASALETTPTDTEQTGGQSASPRAAQALVRIVLFSLLLATAAAGTWYALDRNSKNGAPVMFAPFAQEKLSNTGKTQSVAISPDGKLVAYAHEIGGRQSLWLKRLDAAGENTQVIPPSEETYHKLAFAPGGDFIYFVRIVETKERRADIYRVSIFGGVPSKIAGDVGGWVSLSPDGEKISFSRRSENPAEYTSLWIADARNGENQRKIAARPSPVRISDGAFSHDGKQIVFAAGQSENAANEFSLFEIDLETGAERAFAESKFFNIRYLAWLPENNGLILTASRIPNKNFQIWHIPADRGEALPLTNDAESYSALSLDKNATLIAATKIKEDFHLRLIDFEDPSAVRELTSAYTVAFAPNGKIIFSSPMSGRDEIWSINADGSEQRQLTNNGADEFYPVVSASRSLIYYTSNLTGEMQVWRMNTDGTDQTQITKKNGGLAIFAAPDGNWIYYLHGIDRTVWRVSTVDGAQEQVFNQSKYRFAFSPDGARLAFGEKRGADRFLTLVSVPDSKTIKTIRFPDPKLRLLEMVWMPGGKNILCLFSDDESRNATLWIQAIDENIMPNQRKIMQLGDDEVSQLAISPDGKTIAVAQGGWRHDAVLLKGLK